MSRLSRSSLLFWSFDHSVLPSNLCFWLVDELRKAQFSLRDDLRVSITIGFSPAKPTTIWNFGTADADLDSDRFWEVVLKLFLVIFFDLFEDLNELEVDGICCAFFDVEC